MVTNPGVKDHIQQEEEGEAEVDIKPLVMIIIVEGACNNRRRPLLSSHVHACICIHVSAIMLARA